MDLNRTLNSISRALSSAGIDHALIGGFALAAYGVVRATVDIDLLVDGRMKSKAKAACLKSGFSIVNETGEVLQLSGAGQVDMVFANREPTQKMLVRASVKLDFPIKIVLPEDLIGLKIQAYRNDPTREYQDKADIHALMKANPGLDLNIVRGYADLFGEWKTIESMRKKI